MSNWNASAVVSRVFGTTSTHSSTSRPVVNSVGLIVPMVWITSDSLLGGITAPAAGGSPTQRSPFWNGSCATLRLSRAPH